MTEKYMGNVDWNQQHDDIDPYNLIRNDHVDRTTRLLERQILPWFCNAVATHLNLGKAFDELDRKFNPMGDLRERSTLLKITDPIRRAFTEANTIPANIRRFQILPPGKNDEEFRLLIAEDCAIVRESDDTDLIESLSKSGDDITTTECFALLDYVFGDGHELTNMVVDRFWDYREGIRDSGPYLFKIMETERRAVELQLELKDD